MFWVLAENPDVQSKLRDEIVTTRKEHGNFDYDTLQALPYLDAVCRETLRVYPPVSSVIREYEVISIHLFRISRLFFLILSVERYGDTTSIPYQIKGWIIGDRRGLRSKGN